MTVKAVDSITIIDQTDLDSIKTWYIAVPRTSAAPVVSPNATEAQMRSAGWGTVEPGVDTTKKLYTVQQNIFGDGTYIWGSICLSSSYEAAIQAYNLANTANTNATKYITYVDAEHGIRVHNENDMNNFSQINSGGMQVYQAGDEVASFGGNAVNLGKNSPESVIKMCYEKMAVAARYGELTDIASNNAEYDTTLDFDFNLTTFSTKVNHGYGLYEFIYESSDGWTLNYVVGDEDRSISNVNLAQYGITMHTANINDYASIYISYFQGSHIKLSNTDTQMPSRKLELELAEGASTSDSDYANLTIERQTQEYAGGDINQHSIITMMTVHDQANVATLQLFDDEISFDAGHMYFNGGNAEFSDDIIDGYGNKLSSLANLIKPASLSLGSYVAAGILTSSSGTLTFSIPTGRSYPSGTTISRLSFAIVARAGNKNSTGMYIVKSTSGGSSGASFTKGSAFSFYNGANASKSLAASKVTVSLYGGTNIYVNMVSGTDYFFSGNSTNNGYVNNQPVVVFLTSISVGFSIP